MNGRAWGGRQFLPEKMIRNENGYRFVDHEITLGRRRAIARVEYSLLGMKESGYRKVHLSPHLARDGSHTTRCNIDRRIVRP
jgi:hypothetical protein